MKMTNDFFFSNWFVIFYILKDFKVKFFQIAEFKHKNHILSEHSISKGK